jgi:hypothetical protein
MSGFCSCSAASFFCCCWSHDLMDCSAFLVTELSLCGLVSLACLARQPCLHSHWHVWRVSPACTRICIRCPCDSLSLRPTKDIMYIVYAAYCWNNTNPIRARIWNRIPVLVGLCSDRRHKEIVTRKIDTFINQYNKHGSGRKFFFIIRFSFTDYT